MFKTARVKLTLQYLVIIMTITLFFSLVIHSMLMRQVRAMVMEQRFRIEKNFGLTSRFDTWDIDFVKDTDRQITLTLMIVNGIIFISSGVIGYLMAGKTLKPIQDMVDEQKRFVTDSSHELRTPLTSLKSAIEVGLRDKKLTLKEAKILLEENLDDVNKLQTLSDSLLKLSSQKYLQSSPKKSTDISAVIALAVKNVKNISESKKILVKSKVPGHPRVFGNRDELVELFTILLDNAIKYSPTGSKVSILVKKDSKSLTVKVIDLGVGIAKSDIPHVFDRFFRGDIARSKTGTSGFGLGLSIAKKIADDHSAEISVVSSVQKGSTFLVSFRKIVSH